MTLSDRQAEFTRAFAALTMVAQYLKDEQGRPIKVVMEDVHRDPEWQDILHARNPRGAVSSTASFHTRKLAGHLLVFSWTGDRWVYRRSTIAYENLGRVWEMMGGTWGGRFTRPDGNHFSRGE